jgi:hypothetical protein
MTKKSRQKSKTHLLKTLRTANKRSRSMEKKQLIIIRKEKCKNCSALRGREKGEKVWCLSVRVSRLEKKRKNLCL